MAVFLNRYSLALVVLGALCGAALGIGCYTLYYAKGFSYLSDRPEVCINCHIMNSYFDSWQKSGHHHAARCVDCHLPHTFVEKYFAKAQNGYLHSKAFTLQNFHEPIQMRKSSREILNDNCLYCHKDFVSQTTMPARGSHQGVIECTRCHSSAGHGPRN